MCVCALDRTAVYATQLPALPPLCFHGVCGNLIGVLVGGKVPVL